MLSRSTFETAGGLALGLLAMSASVSADYGVAAAASGPCDIYAAGGTPCVAAHSTTRALYGSFAGALYEVIRGSDNTTMKISPVSAGGIANSGAQDTFCNRTTCLISTIYDQSGNGNHLTQAPGGRNLPGPDVDHKDNLASAVGAPVTLNGKRVYGVFSPPGTGYRNNQPKGTAQGDGPEGMYAIFDGTHYNGNCCYDYGNAENNTVDKGPGTMEAIYFGNANPSGAGTGDGPWILADLEDGLFSGGNRKQNPSLPSMKSRFVTAVVKGKSNQWAIRGGDGASGSLSTFYSGVRPNDYNPMKKDGAIILGVGGDNSPRGQGTFYEGVMTSGYPSDDTENSVQANIVAAKYGATSLTSGPGLKTNSSVSLRVTTPGITEHYISHDGADVSIQFVNSSSSSDDKKQASFTVRTGLGFAGCSSFESVDKPGSFIRHLSFNLSLDANDGSKKFAEDATFCPQSGLNGQGNSLRSWNYPTRFFRHYQGKGWAASNGGVDAYDAPRLFNDDASFVVTEGFA